MIDVVFRIAAALAGLLVVACGAPATLGGVRMTTNVPEATLYVDDELRGPAQDYEGYYLPLEPGRHVLRLEDRDHITTRVEVVVAAGVGMSITLEMQPYEGTQ